MKEEKIQILYTIKGIKPYEEMKGYVMISLTPVDKLPQLYLGEKPKVHVSAVGPSGEGIPQEIAEQMQEIFQQLTGSRTKINNKRDITLIESEISFQKRGWNYGDIITGTFEKRE
jgi:hypothetical protein